MKLVRSAPLAFVTLCLSAMVLLSASTAQAQFTKNKALVRSVTGDATVTFGGKTSAVKKLMFIEEGSIVKTMAKSFVDLYLGDNGPFVRVTPNSDLRLDKLLFRKSNESVVIETSLNLRRGRILGQVKKTSPASIYEVVTPTMVAGIRGTTYDISADGLTKVFDGQVVVAYEKDGQVPTYLVNKNQKFDPTNQQVVPLDPSIDPTFEPQPLNPSETEQWQSVEPEPTVITDVSTTTKDAGFNDPTNSITSDSGTSFISPTESVAGSSTGIND